MLHALGDPVRLEIVQALAGRAERPCSDLHGVGGITVATLSHHLRVLREAGLTRTRVSGKHRFLSLRLAELEQRFPGMITSVLRAGRGAGGPAGAGRSAAVGDRGEAGIAALQGPCSRVSLGLGSLMPRLCLRFTCRRGVTRRSWVNTIQRSPCRARSSTAGQRLRCWG